MPELPEVETVVRQLRPAVQGRHLRELRVFDEKIGPLEGFLPSGYEVFEVRRLGKQIVFVMRARKTRGGLSAKPSYLVVHLRMTGRLLWKPAGITSQAIPQVRFEHDWAQTSPEKHVRAKLIFAGGEVLFSDVRRFGTLCLTEDISAFNPRGLDPLTAFFTVRAFQEMLSCSSQEIKQFLLRQDRLVGLGNIYVCEALFRAKVDPRRSACSLSPEETRKLHHVIIKLLLQAIDYCGTTFSDFQNADGVEGQFQKLLRVYQRETKPCRTCKAKIARIVQQGRSTFYCPKCQKV